MFWSIDSERSLRLEMLRDGRHDSFGVVLTLCTYPNQRNLAAFKESVFECVVFLGAVSGVRRIIQLDCGKDGERLSVAQQEVDMLRGDSVESHTVSPRASVDFKDVSETDLGEKAVISRGNARFQTPEEFGLCRSEDSFPQSISGTIEAPCPVFCSTRANHIFVRNHIFRPRPKFFGQKVDSREDSPYHERKNKYVEHQIDKNGYHAREGYGLVLNPIFGDSRKVQHSEFFVEADVCQENAGPDAENKEMTCAAIFSDYVAHVAPLQPATLAVPAAAHWPIRKLWKNRGELPIGFRCLRGLLPSTNALWDIHEHKPKRNSGMEKQTSESNGVQLMSKRELSRLLSCSIRTVDRLVARGELPLPFKVGSGSRFSLADVYRYIESLKSQRGMQSPQA